MAKKKPATKKKPVVKHKKTKPTTKKSKPINIGNSMMGRRVSGEWELRQKMREQMINDHHRDEADREFQTWTRP